MPNLQLSLACSDNPRTRPLIDGIVKPDGIDLHITVLHPSEMFWRQLHFTEFDVSEMSMSSLIMTTQHGDSRWVGIPIFTSRRFYHTGILVRVGAGIEKPEDLKGKRVGVPEYQQTAALWTRAALDQMYGVKAQDMRWWMERNEERSHGGATGFKAPADIEFHYIDPSETIATMLLSGGLDASILYISANNLVDRSKVDLSSNPDIRPLFPDQRSEGIAYYRKTGFFPINHGFVMKREVYEQQPWVLLNLFNAFSKARDMVNEKVKELTGPYLDTGLIDKGGIGQNLYPYGVRSNQEILTAITAFSHAQGLTERVVRLDEIFAEQTLDL